MKDEEEEKRPVSGRRGLWLWIGLLLVALVLRLGAGFWWQSRLGGQFGFPDSESYWALAHSIAQGQPYQFGQADAKVFRTPGYPLLLAPLFLWGGPEPPVIWARVLSALFGTAAIVCVGSLGLVLFNRRVALVAAALAAFYPGAVALGAFVLSEAPFCPLVVAHLTVWAIAWKTRSKRRSLLYAGVAGLLAGAATLVRPSWLLFVPFAVLLGILLGANPKRHAILGLSVLAGLMLAMTPWWVRNAVVTGHFVPTTLQVGASLYDGLNPIATGDSDMRFVPGWTEYLHAQSAKHPEQSRESFEYRLDRQLFQAATAWAWRHPKDTIRLAGKKLWRFWRPWPSGEFSVKDSHETFHPSFWVRAAFIFTLVPIVILAIIGAWRTARRGWPYVLCWLPAVYLSLIHAVFVSSIRYREPTMLPLMVLAAAVIVSRKSAKEGRLPLSGA